MRFAKLFALSIFSLLAVIFAHAARAEAPSFITDTTLAARINETRPQNFATIQSGDLTLDSFRTDGCSSFYEEALTLSGLIHTCCVEHDFRYWVGGTADERKKADQYLRDCVKEATPFSFLASNMYNAVRAFGRPNTGASYQWGYGWKTSTGQLANVGYTNLRDEKLAPGICKMIQSEYERKESHLPRPYRGAPARPMPTCER